jgi:hypothetical protein
MKKKQPEIIELLGEARKTEGLVWLKRTMDAQAWRGIVVGIDTEWALIQKLNTQMMRLAGYCAIRVADLERLWWDTTFASSALKLLGERAKPQPDVLLVDLPGVLSSAGTLYPLIEVYQEPKQTHFYVGRIVAFGEKKFTFQTVQRSGEWGVSVQLRYKNIARVEFGDGYDQALWLVARRERRNSKS